METAHAQPAVTSPAVPRRRPAAVAVRVMAIAAAVWAIAFAALNGWVQYAALRTGMPLAGHGTGLAILNGVAVMLKLVGVVLALSAIRARPPARPLVAGLIVAGLAAAVATLASWSVMNLVVLIVRGTVSDPLVLAGGALAVPGWLYPLVFAVGALAFSGPAWHARGSVARPRRWIVAGALLGPPTMIAALSVTGYLLNAAGLLPAA